MIVYENDGHRRRMMKTYHHFAWKMVEWRKDPHCRNCKREMYIYPLPGLRWQDQCTVDHIVSRGNGGSDTEDNFQLWCSKCNNDKSKTEQPQTKGKVYIEKAQLEALLRKADLLAALKQEGVKKTDVWVRAQLRVKSSIDNS